MKCTCEENKNFDFATAVDQDKCLKLIKLSISKLTFAPIIEVPSNISTILLAFNYGGGGI